MSHSSYTLDCVARISAINLFLTSLDPPHLILVPLGHATRHPKRHLDRVSRFSTIHGRHEWTDRQNDDGTTRLWLLDLRKGCAYLVIC